MFAVIFLPDYAGMALDAIARVAYRRIISHRLLLEWETAQDAHRRARNQQWQFVLAGFGFRLPACFFSPARLGGNIGDGGRGCRSSFCGLSFPWR